MNLDGARAALIADARADAELLLAEADRDAHERLARADEEAAALMEAANTEGTRQAAERGARQRAGARRDARQIVLTAQRRALDELRERARTAARELAHDERYPELLDRLRTLAAAQLGPDAEIAVDPDGEPGVVGNGGHRRVDCRLVTLADRAVDGLGSEVATLWT
jgi:vacuolar-type H+-ATPase subunit E/Vma4